MKVLFDTNVVLDVLLDRAPHADVAARLMSFVDEGRIDGVICATTVTTIHYLASKTIGSQAAANQLNELLSIFDVACVDRPVLQSALDLGFDDFEDAVLHQAALDAGTGAIVTRNGKDFADSKLPVFEPDELHAAIVASGDYRR